MRPQRPDWHQILTVQEARLTEPGLRQFVRRRRHVHVEMAYPTNSECVSNNEDQDARTYDVVVNREEQFSVPANGKPIPYVGGSAKAGLRRSVCSTIVGQWTDARPLNLRE